MLKEAIEHIEQNMRPEIIKAEGRDFSSRKIFDIKEELPNAISIKSLPGLIDYVGDDFDNIEDGEMMIVINAINDIIVVGQLTGRKNRPVFAHLNTHFVEFQFDTYMSIEDFTIGLHTRFVHTEALEEVLKFISLISAEQEDVFTDDGVSQTVAIKQGITQRADAQVPSPVVLEPYRIYPELDQVESAFKLRMKRPRGDQEPKCALFQCDGGAWISEARERIYDYIKKNLPGIIVVR